MSVVICPRCGEAKSVRLIAGVGNKIFCGNCKKYFLRGQRSGKTRPCNRRETSSGLKYW